MMRCGKEMLGTPNASCCCFGAVASAHSQCWFDSRPTVSLAVGETTLLADLAEKLLRIWNKSLRGCRARRGGGYELDLLCLRRRHVDSRMVSVGRSSIVAVVFVLALPFHFARCCDGLKMGRLVKVAKMPEDLLEPA